MKYYIEVTFSGCTCPYSDENEIPLLECEKEEVSKSKVKKTSDIYSKIENNNHEILEQICEEEKEIDKLFDLIKQKPYLGKISRYQTVLKDKYSKELLEFYKSQILDEAKRVSDRIRYQELCEYITKMSELNNSDDFVFDMLTEMYESYKSKRAFKEEISAVLSGTNKTRFQELLASNKK